MMTEKYGLLGKTLGHSFSPQIHALLGDYPYALYEVGENDVERFMSETDLAGMNVTIPYKHTDTIQITTDSGIWWNRLPGTASAAKRA